MNLKSKEKDVNPVRDRPPEAAVRHQRCLVSNGVKLFIGFIFVEEGIYLKAKPILERRFGRSDFESQILPFNHTRYYEKEFGRNLKRRFLSFQRLQRSESLMRIKIITNKIEQRLASFAMRRINIDPGVLSLSKVVIATTKDYKHRIYLGRQIYAEVTLYYQDNSFRSWEWTYPDYKTTEYIQIFNRIRDIYSHQI